MRRCCGILLLMRSLRSHSLVTLILLICLVCPIVETIDSWDHTLETGNDTEYTLVVLALCIGTVFTLARLIITLSANFSVSSANSMVQSLQNSLFFLIAPPVLVPVSGSPPLNLRI